MAEIDPLKVVELEELLDKIKAKPSLLDIPALGFLKEFLLEWGAKIPEAGPARAEKVAEDKSAEKPAAEESAAEKEAAEKKAAELEDDEPEDEPMEEVVEEDDPERLPEDTEPFPEFGPNGTIELTEEQITKQGELKQAAIEAVENGKLEEALVKITEAIKIGSPTALMIARRADLLLKLKRPRACINDCEFALKLNPDNGKAYRIRGKAYRYLCDWGKAHADLAKAQMMDYDDEAETVALKKLVDEKFKVIDDRLNAKRIKDEARALKKKEKEVKRRQEMYKKAQADLKKQQEERRARGESDSGGREVRVDPATMNKILAEPEMKAHMADPKVGTAIHDIMSSPNALAKYQHDPIIMNVVEKLMTKIEEANVAKGMNPDGTHKVGKSASGATPGTAAPSTADAPPATAAPTTAAPTTTTIAAPAMSGIDLSASEPSAKEPAYNAVDILPSLFALAVLMIGLTSFRKAWRFKRAVLEHPLMLT